MNIIDLLKSTDYCVTVNGQRTKLYFDDYREFWVVIDNIRSNPHEIFVGGNLDKAINVFILSENR
jgi:hypothetical protein